MGQLRRTFAALGLFALVGSVAHVGFAATPPNQANLNDCQKTVRAEAAKFVKAEIYAISTCLQRIAYEQIRNNAAIDNVAARTCIAQFRKLHDTRGLGKSLIEQLTAKIQKKCDPTFNPLLMHTIDDITGKNTPTVPKPINTKQLDTYCQNFGGDGSIDSVPEWINCIVAAHQCEAEQAIAEQYPRAAEWLTAVKPIMQLIPPPAKDLTRTSDAVAGVASVNLAIDSDADNKPDISCPQPPPAPSCATACCYMEEQILVGAMTFTPTSCFQYRGTATEVSTFKSRCNATTSGGFWSFKAIDGACSAGPTYSVACVVGSGSNASAIPNDTACP